MSSTDIASSTSTTPPYPSGGWIGNNRGGTSQSSLYLFTFLIVLVILGLISVALLLRAYYIRRRFRRRIQEAIINGQALPPDALAALGVRRGVEKKEKKVGPMPVMWEAEMYRDYLEDDGSKRGSMIDKDATRITEKEVALDEGEDDWRGLTPVGMFHYPTGEPKLPPPPAPPIPILQDRMPRRQLLRSLFRPDDYDPIEHIRQAELNRTKTRDTSPAETTFEVPEQGSEVVLGVMIAFPSQEGGSDRWSLSSDVEEQQVPDVCLGIMEATIGEKR